MKFGSHVFLFWKYELVENRKIVHTIGFYNLLVGYLCRQKQKEKNKLCVILGRFDLKNDDLGNEDHNLSKILYKILKRL